MLKPLVTNSGPAMSLPLSASTMIVIVTNPSDGQVVARSQPDLPG